MAARFAGIDYATFAVWMKRGRAEEKGPFRDFVDALEGAEAEAEVLLVDKVRAAAPKDWRAALAVLERRHAKRWGIQLNLALDRELQALLDKIRKTVNPDVYESIINSLAADDEPGPR